jgi:hypothetical protein
MRAIEYICMTFSLTRFNLEMLSFATCNIIERICKYAYSKRFLNIIQFGSEEVAQCESVCYKTALIMMLKAPYAKPGLLWSLESSIDCVFG